MIDWWRFWDEVEEASWTVRTALGPLPAGQHQRYITCWGDVFVEAVPTGWPVWPTPVEFNQRSYARWLLDTLVT
jgi:hypothetical protein